MFGGKRGEHAIVFSTGIQHDAVAVSGFEPIAGGFVDLWIVGGDLNVRCYGRSLSLGLKSRGGVDESVVLEVFDV